MLCPFGISALECLSHQGTNPILVDQALQEGKISGTKRDGCNSKSIPKKIYSDANLFFQIWKSLKNKNNNATFFYSPI